MAEALKAQFGVGIITRLSSEIADVHASFDRRAFERDAENGYEALELMARGRHLGAMLHRYLPSDFGRAVDVLLATLPAQRQSEGGMSSFFYLPHTEFVRAFGLAHFAPAMRALHALTQHFTGEFAIRPFLMQHQAETLQQLGRWASDPNEHVRRLVSEGTRPRLPWAPRLRAFQQDPSAVIRLLELLRDDPSLYVRRSVANSLNDIGKDHPARLVATAKAWLEHASDARRWVVAHALRSAVKRGDPAALAVLGFTGAARLDLVATSISPRRPVMGSRVTITMSLQNSSRRRQRAVVDLIVHFVKSHGGTSAKVFKLAVVDAAPAERIELRKTISLAELSTRRHYAGEHRLELQMNGEASPLGSFTLIR